MRVPIVDRAVPAPGHVELLIEAPDLARDVIPGQFAHVLTPGRLRRPLSFSRVEGEAVGLLFRVVGAGTAWLGQRQPGEWLDIMAPLGHGFPDPGPGSLCLVGGGVGIPPLYLAAQRFGQHRSLTAMLGAKTANQLIMAEDFARLGILPQLCTDDGTQGEPMRVTGLLKRWLESNPDGVIMACGPMAMLAAVAELAGRQHPAWLALEQRMGCGVGACLACVVPAVGPNGSQWVRVCRDGPVFSASALVFSGHTVEMG